MDRERAAHVGHGTGPPARGEGSDQLVPPACLSLRCPYGQPTPFDAKLLFPWTHPLPFLASPAALVSQSCCNKAS